MIKYNHGTEEGLRYGIKRSPEWESTRIKHLQKEPQCAICGILEFKKGLQVHHIFPFHYCVALGRPDLELDHRNLITLCESEKEDKEPNHHLLIGHLNDFKSSNLNVKDDVRTYFKQDEKTIKSSTIWQVEEKRKLKPLDEMSEQEKQNFQTLMNTILPKL